MFTIEFPDQGQAKASLNDFQRFKYGKLLEKRTKKFKDILAKQSGGQQGGKKLTGKKK
jgi:hypothetical protein